MIVWPPAYKIKRHRRARYVKLRASRIHGLQITVPYRFNLNEIPSILEEKKAWIEKYVVDAPSPQQLEALPPLIELNACQESWTVCYLDANTKLTVSPRHHLREIAIVGNIHDTHSCKMKLVEWVKNRAKSVLPVLLDEVSKIMQLTYADVVVRDQKTLWGSCSVAKIINLNYKLLFLPSHLVTHIIIHELSHTVHHNHSKKFWDLVAKYDLAWKEHRRELRQADKFIPLWVG